MTDGTDGAVAYFTTGGFEVRVEEHDLRAEHIARGEPGRASFFAEGRMYYCVDLVRDGKTVVRQYAHADTAAVALVPEFGPAIDESISTDDGARLPHVG
jgi:hypothetical protein